MQYMEQIEALLRVRDSFDILCRRVEIGGRRARLYVVDGLCKDEILQKLLQFWMEIAPEDMQAVDGLARFSEKYLAYTETEVCAAPPDMAKNLLSGAALLFLEPYREALVVDARTYPARSVGEPDDERVLRGAHDGFVETLIFNVALLRRRIRDTQLTIEAVSVGRRSKTDVAIAYLAGKADAKFVKSLRARIARLDVNALTMGQESLTEALVKKGWYNPFPKVRYTERPDSAAAAIAEGRVVVMIDNSASVMLLPVSLFDFMQENNDFCFPPAVGGYLRLVRMIVFLLTIYLTPVWYLLIQRPERLPQWVSFIAVEQPTAVPVIFQLFIFELAIDALKLASLNTPSALSNSFSVIGALILGDFAVQARWFVPEVILYMGLVAIGNFTQPSYELSYAFKLTRLLILALTAVFGAWGFWAGQAVLVLLLATNRTVSGGSYLYPLFPFDAKALRGVFLRGPMNKENS